MKDILLVIACVMAPLLILAYLVIKEEVLQEAPRAVVWKSGKWVEL